MRRFIFVVAAGIGLLVVGWKMAEKAGPAMAERCEVMLANMPDSFPPKRMMSDLEAIREQTDRILEIVEDRQDMPRAAQA